jgi:hypothetical protein
MERLPDGKARYAKREIQAGGSLWICYEDRKEHIWVCHYGKQPMDISFENEMSARISPPTCSLRGEGWKDDPKLIAFLSRVGEAIRKKGL